MGNSWKKWVLAHAVIIFVILILFAAMAGYTYCINHQGFTVNADETDDYSIVLDRTKQWSEEAHGYVYGMQYDVTVGNHTYGDTYEWKVDLKLIEGCHVDSYWNGEVTFKNDILSLVPMDYNKDIVAGGHETFGFILYSNSLDNVLEKLITVYMHVDIQDLPLYWMTWISVGILCVVDITMVINAFRTRALRRKHEESLSIINQSLLTFANMIDTKDLYTKGHSQRVAIYAREIAKRMGIGMDERQKLYYIAMLHDIGKIGIDDSILKKKDKLTPAERLEIEAHVQIGGDILKDFNAIPGSEEGARYHHEHYDGNGYVYGLKGEEIPLYARIIGIADAFDAMSSARCYRPKLSIEKIIQELKDCSGTQFDPAIIPYMLDMIAEKKVPIELDEKQLYRDLGMSEL